MAEGEEQMQHSYPNPKLESLVSAISLDPFIKKRVLHNYLHNARHLGGARGVMVTDIGNRHDDKFKSCMRMFASHVVFYTLGKVINSIILPLAMNRS